MLAELAAANAAFAVIKSALANGRELSDLGGRVFDYFNAKSKIQEQATKKGGGSELEEFMALEKLRLQEEELRERMIYAGRPGLWEDWLRFQAAAARKRREAKEAAARAALVRKAKMELLVEYIAIGIATVILAGMLIYGMVLYVLYIKR
jgi:hypothetical protein